MRKVNVIFVLLFLFLFVSHRFTVDRWKSIGTNVEMMFCSSQVIEIKSLRKAIRKCLKKVSSAASKKTKPTSIINGTESVEDASIDQSQTSGTMSRTSNASYNSYKHCKFLLISHLFLQDS